MPAVAAALLILQAGLLSWLVTHQRVNPDEGIYLTASYRVMSGQLPYRDFLYPQMPYFAFFFVPLMEMGLPPLTSARAMCALCSLTLTFVLYRELGRRRVPDVPRLVMLAFFVLNSLKLSSHATAITHAPADLLGLLSLIALDTAHPALAGLALGGAVGIRLPLAPLFGVYALALWWRGRSSDVFWLAGGFALALAPALPLLALDPENFVFGTYTLHTIRGNFPSLAAALHQKLAILVKWLFFPQNLLLFTIIMGGGRAVPPLPAAAAAVLGLAFLQASPTYLIYVVELMPFLFIAAIPGFVRLADHRGLLVAASLLYVISFLPALGLSPVTIFSEQDKGKLKLWGVRTVATVARIVSEHSAPGDLVLSWWEGYPTLAERNGYVGVGFWESNAARKLGDPRAEKAHCMTLERIGTLIGEGAPAVIVAAPDVWTAFRTKIEERYERIGDVESVAIYARRRSH